MHTRWRWGERKESVWCSVLLQSVLKSVCYCCCVASWTTLDIYTIIPHVWTHIRLDTVFVFWFFFSFSLHLFWPWFQSVWQAIVRAREMGHMHPARQRCKDIVYTDDTVQKKNEKMATTTNDNTNFEGSMMRSPLLMYLSRNLFLFRRFFFYTMFITALCSLINIALINIGKGKIWFSNRRRGGGGGVG